jgi:hypothetical protein
MPAPATTSAPDAHRRLPALLTRAARAGPPVKPAKLRVMVVERAGTRCGVSKGLGRTGSKCPLARKNAGRGLRLQSGSNLNAAPESGPILASGTAASVPRRYSLEVSGAEVQLHDQSDLLPAGCPGLKAARGRRTAQRGHCEAPPPCCVRDGDFRCPLDCRTTGSASHSDGSTRIRRQLPLRTVLPVAAGPGRYPGRR